MQFEIFFDEMILIGIRDRAVTETKAAGKMPALPGKILVDRNWKRGRLARFLLQGSRQDACAPREDPDK